MCYFSENRNTYREFGAVKYPKSHDQLPALRGESTSPNTHPKSPFTAPVAQQRPEIWNGLCFQKIVHNGSFKSLASFYSISGHSYMNPPPNCHNIAFSSLKNKTKQKVIGQSDKTLPCWIV